MIDVYESAVDPSGRYGAAFERDEETAFFYLLDLARAETNQIIEAFNAHIVTAMPADVQIELQWNADGEVVGLRIDGDLIAVFDLRSKGRKGRIASNDDERLFIFY